MAFSRYYAAQATNGSGVLAHTIANPDNASFGYLHLHHLEFRISSAGQSLVAFKTALDAGIAKLTNYNDYTIADGVFTIPADYGLTESATYQLQIKRVTPKLTHYVNFNAGAPITETDLDNSNSYALFRSQELEDGIQDVIDFGFVLTLAEMKSVAGITGEFTGDTDTQIMTNKAFTAGTAITSTFDLGTASWQ